MGTHQVTFDPDSAVPEAPFDPSSAAPESAPPVRAVLHSAVKVNPDQAARARVLGKAYDAPAEMVLRNLQDVEFQAAVDKADAKLKTSPKLAIAMRTRPEIAPLMHDDIEKLSEIESNFATVAAASVGQAVLGVSEGIWRTPDAAQRAVGYLASTVEKTGLPAYLNPIRGVQDVLQFVSEGRAPIGPKLFAGTTDVADKVNDAQKILTDKPTFGSAFADVQTLAQNADKALATAVKTGNLQQMGQVLTDPNYWSAFLSQAVPSLYMAMKSGGSVAFMGWMEGMEQAGNAAEFEKKTGQKISDAEFTQAVAQTAIVNALLEKFGLDKVLGAKGKGITGIVKAVFAEGGTEGLQQLNSNLAAQLAYDGGKSLSEGVLASIMGGAGAGGGISAVQAAAGQVEAITTKRAQQADAANKFADHLQTQLQAATGALLRERSPEQFRELMGEMSDGKIYVDGEVLNQLPPEIIATLPQAVQDQIAEAAAANSTVEIPVADVLTLAPGTPLEQVIIENARSEPGALSQADAKAAAGQAQQMLQMEAERVIAQAADQDAFRASSDAVKATILGELNTAGRFRAKVNEGMATWATAFYTTMAARTGMTPEQFYATHRLRILGAPSAAAAGPVMDQGKPGEVAVEGYHFSAADRPTLTTGAFGTGLRGSARDEIMNHPDKRLKERLSFYVDLGQGITPESGVGGRAHRAQLTNVYDSDADPLKLRGGDARAFEVKVLDAGYSGYLSRMGGASQGQVVMLGAQTIQPELLGAQSRITNGQRPPALPRVAPTWQTQASGDPVMLQAKLEKMQASPSWAAYDLRIEGRELQAMKKEVLEQKVQKPGKPVPTTVDNVANVESAFELANGQQFKTNRDLKLALQERVLEALKAGKISLDDFNAGAEQYLVRVALVDAQIALQTNPNAVGWYNEKVTKALRLLALVHPEIQTDPQAKFAFVWAMAVTSNGLKVDKNFELAEQAYATYKATGKMPTDVQAGKAQAAINNGLALFNEMLAAHGFEALQSFMTTKATVKEIQAFSGLEVGGENLTTEVYGSAILGPKIGNGFFSNLYGRFEQLTMDRWLMRTWGRWTGTLVETNPDQVRAKRVQLRSLIQALDKDQKKAFETIIKRKLTVGDPDEVALAIWKSSQKPINRARMAAVADAADPAGQARLAAIMGPLKKGQKRSSFGDELRKVGNALTNYNDGQKEAPSGPPERGRIRKVFAQALGQLQENYPALTMSDLQALLWYPEKRLYDAAKATGEGDTGYEDDAAPDYANSAAKLAREKGVPEEDIARTIKEVDDELRATDRAAGAGRTAGGEVPAGETAAGGVRDGSGLPGSAGVLDPQAGDLNGQAGNGGGRYSSGGLAPLAGAPAVAGATGPDLRLVAVAEQYAADNGIDLRRQGIYAEVDPERAARIAAAYEAMAHAPNDPAVREAYADLLRQTTAQYLALQAAGYKFWFMDPGADPYQGNPWNAMRDLRATQSMAVFPTEAGFGSGGQVNIGLADPNGGPNLDPAVVLEALRIVGAEVEASAIHSSDTEPTLVVKVKKALTKEQGDFLSGLADQEAIAQRTDNEKGSLFGPMAEKWGPFNPTYFVTPAGVRADEIANPLLQDTGITWAYGSPDGEQRPVLANDLFRAVHDAFGHGLEGAGFRAQGEENAWQAHRGMFTGPALGALTSETRGQNSWLNYGPHGEANKTAKVEDTVFAEQKTGIMPEWTWAEGVVEPQDETLKQSTEFPRIDTFQGLKLRKVSANIKVSAASAFADGPFTIQPGVREVPLTDVVLQDTEFLRSPKEQARIADLAAAIQTNGSIEPLFVAQRLDGTRYVAEGQHRAYALRLLGYTSIPARVMVESGGTLSQEQQTPRGTFNPRTLELVLNPNANLSTFFHETGHFFLEVMADIASQPNAPAQIVEDMATFLKWAGITGDEDVGGADSGVLLAQRATRADKLAAWFGEDSTMTNPDGTPRALYHGTTKAGARGVKAGQFRRSKTGAMGPAVYLGDDAEASAGYDQGATLQVYARGKYLTNMQWSDYVSKHGWAGAEAAATADGWAGVYDEAFENAVAVWNPENIKSVDAKQFVDDGTLLGQDGQPTPDAPPVQRKRTALETWNAMTLDQKRKYHERWAESIEQYVMEGKAPSAELAPLMRRFATWLKSVYGSIKQMLAARPDAEATPLNDDIRRVMDRLLATDEQIAQANEVAGLVPDADADALAAERLNKRSMADLKWAVKARDQVIGKLRKQAAAIEKDLREQVTVEVDQAPEMRAKRALDALSVSPEYAGQIAEHRGARKAAEATVRDEVKAALLADNPDVKGLVKGQLLMKNKRDIDNKVDAAMIKWDAANPAPKRPVNATDADVATIADSFGFESVDAMMQAIDAYGPRRDAIDGITQQRMLEEHGDLIDERAIMEAANEAVHNEARARSLATELRTQREMLNPRADTGETTASGAKITVNALIEAAKQFGANVVARTPLRDLKAKAWQHTAAERRAGKAWQAATAAGDTNEAVKAKQDQVLNNAAAKAAIDARAEAKKILEFFKRVTKGNDEKVVEKGRDPDIVNAARATLASYGVATPTTKGAQDYLDTVAKNDPEIYNVIKPMVDAATVNAQPLDALTFEELQALHEEIQAMWHLAKRSRQMEVDGDLMDVEDAAAEVYARLEEIGIPDTVPGETGALTRAEETARRWLQQVPALGRRVEQWAEGKDGKFGGPFLRFIFQPVKDAADLYRTARLEYRKKFEALVSGIAPSMRNELIHAPELGYTFGRGHNGIGTAELLHAILHTGNESNKRKLLLGRQWATDNGDGTIDTAKWDAFIARLVAEGKLTKAHYDFAQGVWDLLEETKPLAQKTHRDVFGRYFAEVTADAFVTPFGTYRGGYVPAQADPALVQDADLRELLETENAGMTQAFPATNKGFTKSRVEYNRPLKLDLRSLGQHIDKVLLFSYMEPAVRGAAKLLRQKNVAQPLARVDPAAMGGMLKPWLNRSARQTVETPIAGDAGLNRIASTIRGRVGMALMFANVSNTLQQLTGFLPASLRVKPTLMLRAAAQFMRHPKQMRESVWSLSPYMADRASNEVAVLSDTMEKILIDPSLYERAEMWTRQHGYFLQTAFDNVMSPIIWSAAYNQAVAEGMVERLAIRFADGTIRQTQGSTLAEDVSRIETGPAYARLFTQFIGYFNMVANTNATALQQIASEQGLKKGAGKAFGVVMMGLLAPIWVAEGIAHAMRGGPDDDDDDGYLDDWLAAVFGFGTIRGILSGVPFIGAAAQSAVNRFNDQPADDKFSLSPTVSVLESAVGAPASVYKAIVNDASAQKAVRDLSALITVATGLPAMTLARPVGFAAGVAQGKIEPTGPVDAARGFVTGTASPDSKQR